MNDKSVVKTNFKTDIQQYPNVPQECVYISIFKNQIYPN